MKFFLNATLFFLGSLLLFNGCGNNGLLDQDTEICNNNIDDDGDGLVDCDDDDCVGTFDCLAGSEICDNNIDDDGDGLIDCEDSNCLGHPNCPPLGAEICDNNFDDDADGLVDCDDDDCINFQDCDPDLGWIEISSFNSSVDELKVIDDQMFVAGNFTERENSTCFWSTILSNNTFDNHTNQIGGSGIRELTLFDDQVYGVGALNGSGGNVGVVIWNGTSWDITGPSNANVSHSSIFTDGTTLYIGSDRGIVSSKTKNSDFEQFPTLSDEGSVRTIIEYDGTLIVGGDFDEGVAYWDGSNWQALGGGADRAVNNLIVYKDKLIAVGSFSEIGGEDINGIAAWDGTNWSSLNGSSNSSFNGLRDMVVYEDELYVLGSFTNIGNIEVNNLAKWNGSNWEGLNFQLDEFLTSIEVYKNKLYVGTSGFPDAFLYRLIL